MSLVKKWKESPLISLSAALIAIATTTFGVVQYFAAQKESHQNEKHAAEIETLKAEIASFKLSLNDVNSFDLESVVLKAGDSNTVPPSSHYFKQDSFYASESTEHWTHREMSESEYYRSANLELTLPVGAQQATRNVSVHTWTSGQPILLGLEGSVIRFQPTILVQRMDDDKLAMALGIQPETSQSGFERANFQFQNAVFDQTSFRDNQNRYAGYEEQQTRLKTVYQALRQDRAGKYFQLFSFQQFQASLTSPSTHYTLNRVQKRGDLLYAQSSTRLDKATINGNPVDQFYIHQEDLFVADQNQVYLIRMTIPSPQPVVEQNQRAELIRWLQKFRIVRN